MLNVLRGEMSLVGLRPPVTYEFERYDLWHKQRLMAVKPGITGLWQVDGRSRVKFGEMVRLDIRYARSWSLWLDIKLSNYCCRLHVLFFQVMVPVKERTVYVQHPLSPVASLRLRIRPSGPACRSEQGPKPASASGGRRA